jgi:hypothetical protein
MSDDEWTPPRIKIDIGKTLFNPYISRIVAETDTSVTFDGHFYKAERDEFLPCLATVRHVNYIRKNSVYIATTQKAALVELLTYTQHQDTSEYFSDEEEFGPGKVCLFPSCIQTVTWRVIRDLPTETDREQVLTALRAKYDPPQAPRPHVHYDDCPCGRK